VAHRYTRDLKKDGSIVGSFARAMLCSIMVMGNYKVLGDPINHVEADSHKHSVMRFVTGFRAAVGVRFVAHIIWTMLLQCRL